MIGHSSASLSRRLRALLPGLLIVGGSLALTAVPAAASTPSFDSGAASTFVVGDSNTFSIEASGSPAPSLAETGALPSGVTFTDNGDGTATLAGDPLSSPGTFPFTITATGDGTSTQDFTLTVSTGGVAATGEATGGAPLNAAPSQSDLQLMGVDCLAATTCVAVGTYEDSSGTLHPMAASESSGTWGSPVEVALPANAEANPATAQLNSVWCSNASDCTAAGTYRDTSNANQAFVVTETAGTWGTATEVSVPAGGTGGVANGISCSSAGNCWVVGGYSGAAGSFAMAAAETSGTWTQAVQVTAPSDGQTNPHFILGAVQCTSATSCTAVGGYNGTTRSEPAAVVETSGTWAQATTIPAPTGNDEDDTLNAISCSDATDCTAVGYFWDTSLHQQLMAATETSGTWAQAVEVTAPSNASTSPEAYLTGVECASAGNCTSTGYYLGSAGIQPAVATQSSGTWAQATELTSPAGDQRAELNGLSCADATDCTAVGSYADAAGDDHTMTIVESAATWGSGADVIGHPSNWRGQYPASDAGYGLSCQSSGNCTAVGTYEDSSALGQAMALPITGGTAGTGTEVSVPAGASSNPNGTLRAVWCSDATDCTAVGTYIQSSGNFNGMTATETGGTWAAAAALNLPANHRVSSPSGGLLGLSCTSSGNCTAVGYYTDTSGLTQAMADVETAGTWAQGTEINPPSDARAAAGFQLQSVSCVDASDCTAVGQYENSANHIWAAIATETAGTWAQAVTAPVPANSSTTLGPALFSVSCSDATHCSAAGYYIDSSNYSEGITIADNGGSWTSTELTPPAGAGTNPGAELESVSCTSAGNCTAVGQYSDTSANGEGMVATETSGTWAQATELTPPAGAGTNPGEMMYSVSCWAPNSCDAIGGDTAQGLVTTSLVPALVVAGSPLAAVEGQAYSSSVAAFGGASTPSLAITDGSLPNGLSMSTSGAISGTPTGAGGDYSFTVQATESGPPSLSAQQTFVLPEDVGASLTDAPSSASFSVGSAGSVSLTASGFPTPSFSVTGALPSGVQLADQGNGTALLAGTPAAGTAGSWPITVKASNGVGSAASASLTIAISDVSSGTSGSSSGASAGSSSTGGSTAALGPINDGVAPAVAPSVPVATTSAVRAAGSKTSPTAVAVSLSCATVCNGHLQLTEAKTVRVLERVRVHGRTVRRYVTKTTSVVLGSATVGTFSGSKSVRIGLNKPGRALLKADRKVRHASRLTLVSTSGKTSTRKVITVS